MAQVGAVVNVGDVNLYLTQRMAEDQAGRKNSTILGAKSPLGKNTKLYSEYQGDAPEKGADRRTSLLGRLQRQWDVRPGFQLAVAGEAANVDDGTSHTKRSAVAATLRYALADSLAAVSRNEVRWEDGIAKRLFQLFSSNQIDYRLGSDFTFLAKYRFSRSEDRDPSAIEARFDEGSVGFAYRRRCHKCLTSKPLIGGQTLARGRRWSCADCRSG